MSDLPVIKIEIEGMRHAMLTHLHQHHDALERAVASQLTAYIESVDLKAMVLAACPNLVEGMVKWMVKDGLDRLRHDPELKDRFATILREAVLIPYPWEKKEDATP